VKLIGIVGGIGPESTVDYYRYFVSIYRGRRPGGGYLPVSPGARGVDMFPPDD
jgi:aspartate/glutamate racemase